MRSGSATVHFEKRLLTFELPSGARSYQYTSLDSVALGKLKAAAGEPLLHLLSMQWTPGGGMGASQGARPLALKLSLSESSLQRLVNRGALDKLPGFKGWTPGTCTADAAQAQASAASGAKAAPASEPAGSGPAAARKPPQSKGTALAELPVNVSVPAPSAQRKAAGGDAQQQSKAQSKASSGKQSAAVAREQQQSAEAARQQVFAAAYAQMEERDRAKDSAVAPKFTQEVSSAEEPEASGPPKLAAKPKAPPKKKVMDDEESDGDSDCSNESDDEEEEAGGGGGSDDDGASESGSEYEPSEKGNAPSSAPRTACPARACTRARLHAHHPPRALSPTRQRRPHRACRKAC